MTSTEHWTRRTNGIEDIEFDVDPDGYARVSAVELACSLIDAGWQQVEQYQHEQRSDHDPIPPVEVSDATRAYLELHLTTIEAEIAAAERACEKRRFRLRSTEQRVMRLRADRRTVYGLLSDG